MIARLIAGSARNVMLIMFGTGFAAAAGIYALVHLPLDAIPDLSDTQVIIYTEYPGPGAAGGRGPGHLSVDDGDAHGAEVEGGARVLVLRRLVRLRHLRGRHRHLLGAFARARIPQRRDVAAAHRRHADDRSGCDRRRLGLPVCRDVEGTEPRRHATIQDWNLVRAGQGRGVAEVASIGGFVKQYNVVLDPQRMRDLGISMRRSGTRSAPATPTSAGARSSCPSSSTSSAATATSSASTTSATSS